MQKNEGFSCASLSAKIKNEEKRAKKLNDARFPFNSKISYFRVKLDQKWEFGLVFFQNEKKR